MTYDPHTDPPTLFDTTRARTTDPWTSHAASESLTPTARNNRCEELFWRIWDSRHEGATVAELVAATGYDRGNTARRITDLHQAGRIRNSGRTRRGPSGRHGIVWIAA